MFTAVVTPSFKKALYQLAGDFEASFDETTLKGPPIIDALDQKLGFQVLTGCAGLRDYNE